MMKEARLKVAPWKRSGVSPAITVSLSQKRPAGKEPIWPRPWLQTHWMGADSPPGCLCVDQASKNTADSPSTGWSSTMHMCTLHLVSCISNDAGGTNHLAAGTDGRLTTQRLHPAQAPESSWMLKSIPTPCCLVTGR